MLAGGAPFGKTQAMNDLALSIRQARPGDAADLARIYISSWQDTYAALLPHSMLGGMSHTVHAQRFAGAIRRGGVILAEDGNEGVVGLASLGTARDSGLGFDGEIYTLYVDPAFLGRGAGAALLHGAFASLKDRAFSSCVIWSHAQNNACFFYEAMGGKRVGARDTRLAGTGLTEIAFGWKALAVPARRIRI